jgi:hypothetical protein
MFGDRQHFMTEKRMSSRAKKGVDNKLKQIVVGSIVTAILAAILGTTIPWWWDRLFPPITPEQVKPPNNPPPAGLFTNSRFDFESGVMAGLPMTDLTVKIRAVSA